MIEDHAGRAGPLAAVDHDQQLHQIATKIDDLKLGQGHDGIGLLTMILIVLLLVVLLSVGVGWHR